MDFNFFKKCIDDITAFRSKVKAMHFKGLGEPLLHEEITVVAINPNRFLSNIRFLYGNRENNKGYMKL